MRVTTSGTVLEEGLSLDAIEERLVACAERHHLEERNMAYWLLEIEIRSLYQERGYASLGDYASELIGITPRKAQYLVFIAHRLGRLPRTAAAFDAGTIPWTKAREIVRVATPETESEWLEKAARLTNRELERDVRKLDGRGSSAFATLTMALPVELLEMWTDCYELAERVSGASLEKFQVLEPMMAEFLATYAAADTDGESEGTERETDDEKGVSAEVRRAVFERDGYQCVVPGCSMRKRLDLHHLKFRSRGGADDPSNLACVCRLHHDLLHRGICSLTGTAGNDLRFERPRLYTEKRTPVRTTLRDEEQEDLTPLVDDDQSWREETVAAVFDDPTPPACRTIHDPNRNVWLEWADAKLAREREARTNERRSRLDRASSGEHVFAGNGRAEASFGSFETPDS